MPDDLSEYQSICGCPGHFTEALTNCPSD